MDLQLQDKVAVVTAASKGIGRAVVDELVAEGAHVVAGARTLEGLQDLDGVTAIEGDLVAPDGPQRLIDTALAEHGRVEILVNNLGGVHPRTEGFGSVSDEDFHASMEINFHAAMRATRAAVAAMLQGDGGAIVNTCSVNAFFQPDGLVIDYGAAKAALLNASKALSQELGPRGIRINCVSPGPVATDLWLGKGGVADTLGTASGNDPGSIPDQVIAGMPSGRFSTPQEVASLIVMLASPRIANVTGADFVIDGGLVKTV